MTNVVSPPVDNSTHPQHHHNSTHPNHHHNSTHPHPADQFSGAAEELRLLIIRNFKATSPESNPDSPFPVKTIIIRRYRSDIAAVVKTRLHRIISVV